MNGVKMSSGYPYLPFSYRRQSTENDFLKPVPNPKSSKILSPTVCVRCCSKAYACSKPVDHLFSTRSPVPGGPNLLNRQRLFFTHTRTNIDRYATVNDVSDYGSATNAVEFESVSRWPTTTDISKWLPKNVHLGEVLIWWANGWPRCTYNTSICLRS